MDWDFEWQGFYYYRQPVKIPAGYKFYSSHFYDNTSNNPFAPNPNSFVIPGQNTTNEMLFDSFQWLDYQAGDENIDIASILAKMMGCIFIRYYPGMRLFRVRLLSVGKCVELFEALEKTLFDRDAG